jgi:hypothetical protein
MVEANTHTAHPCEERYLKMVDFLIPDGASDIPGELQKKGRFLLEQRIRRVS